MKPCQPEISTNSPIACGACQKNIEPENTYIHKSKILCEECCIDARTPRARKTHWQYLGSIKADYLIPGKED